jgi:hypothetical protein
MYATPIAYGVGRPIQKTQEEKKRMKIKQEKVGEKVEIKNRRKTAKTRN